MQDTLHALLELQEVDRQIFRVEAELSRLPEELRKRSEEIERQEQFLAERLEAVRVLRVRIKEIEDITTTQRQRQRKLEGEALKTKGDAALVAAYEHEIRSLKKTIGQAEEDGLELIEEAEGFDTEVRQAEASLAELRSIFEEFSANVARETADAEGRLAVLQEQVDAAGTTGILPEHLALYRSLLRTREGEALAPLEGTICQGCYVGIPKNLAVRLARGGEVVQCPSCDRILYVR